VDEEAAGCVAVAGDAVGAYAEGGVGARDRSWLPDRRGV